MYYSWDKKSQRYRSAETGRFVGEAAMRELSQRAVDQIKTDTQVVADLLIQNKISLATWEETTAQAIKKLHVEQYLLGRGGRKQMTQRDYGIISQELQTEYKYLRKFAEELQTKGMSEAQFKARIRQYLDASNGTKERARMESHLKAGDYLWEKRIRTKTESCNECISYEMMGWQPIGTLPNPTQACSCRSNCGCYKVFSQSLAKPTDFILSNKWGFINVQSTQETFRRRINSDQSVLANRVASS